MRTVYEFEDIADDALELFGDLDEDGQPVIVFSENTEQPIGRFEFDLEEATALRDRITALINEWSPAF